MPAIITSKFRRNNAQAFETSFGSSGNKYYLGIGKLLRLVLKQDQTEEQKI